MELESDCGIYCYKNLINDKKYIGQSKMLRIRIRDHEHNFTKSDEHKLCQGENKLLWKAVRKYGRSNFELYIIQYCSSDELYELELRHIRELNSHVSCHGYNISFGGKSSKGSKFSDETKKKMSKSKEGEKNPFFGKVHTSAVREIISKSKIGISHGTGKDHFNYGRKHSLNSKIKMSKTRSGIGNPNYGKKSKNAKSRYIGVSSDKKGWKAMIYTPKRLYLGRFASELDAALVHDKYVIDNNLISPTNNLGEIQ